MSKRFDSVVGSQRGNGSKGEEAPVPMTVARQFVADLNGPALDHLNEDFNFMANLRAEAAKRGVFPSDAYDIGRDNDFEGFCVPLSATPDAPPFAVLRLDYKQRDGGDFAQLWRLDAG